MNPAIKGLLRFGIDISLPDEATKGGLDMGARAAEPVIKVEMPESGVHVVAP